MRDSKKTRGFLIGLLVFLFWAPSNVASANRTYTVRSGDTLAAIARRQGLVVADLVALNGIDPRNLRPGIVLDLPERGAVVVRSGDTLAVIARRNGTTVSALCSSNRINAGAIVRPGQVLWLPGQERNRSTQRSQRWGKPKTPGVATLIRLHGNQKIRLRLVDYRGRVVEASRRRMAALMRSRTNGGTRRPPRRLVALLARVSDHFGGRDIYVVSGYRPPGGHTSPNSKHTVGHAMDIRVKGVPNEVLRDYCKTFSRVGVGYYPRSHFVHLDVRDRSSYWVDWSRPGEAPMYAEPGEGPPPQIRQASTPGEPEAATGTDETPVPHEPSAPPTPTSPTIENESNPAPTGLTTLVVPGPS